MNSFEQKPLPNTLRWGHEGRLYVLVLYLKMQALHHANAADYVPGCHFKSASQVYTEF